jgi:uncharacterized membrane protein YdjX (TVP38/TMEM64 family)
MSDLDTLIERISTQIFGPIVSLLFALATLYFLWGVAKFIMNVDNEQARSEGKSHMVWGIVGMFIMVAAFTIARIIGRTVVGL